MADNIDTVALFDGASLKGWRGRAAGGQHEWRTADGVSLRPDRPERFAIAPGTGVLVNGDEGDTADLYTEVEHGDCHLHLEWIMAKRSNSGVYLMGRYEVQILDSWGATELTFNTCGGIYARWIDEQHVGGSPPRVNAARPPGEWQSYDIEFRAPRFDAAGRKTADAEFIAVVWNGELVQEHVRVAGPTRAAMLEDERPLGPVALQGDHGPVAYRNIRLQSL